MAKKKDDDDKQAEVEIVEDKAEVMPATVTPQEVVSSNNLFGTDDPSLVIERAEKVASALKDVLVKRGMLATIQGKEYVKVEGWQTLGSMMGVTAVVVSTEKIDDQGYKAKVEARTINGNVVGGAEAVCLKQEKNWASRDDYALLSMAQTRAISKALRGPLGFIVEMAGYKATPAEEMMGVTERIGDAPQAARPAVRPMTDKQKSYINRLVSDREIDKDTEELIKSSIETMSSMDASDLIEKLKSLPKKQEKGGNDDQTSLDDMPF